MAIDVSIQPVYFLSKNDPVVHTFFTNLKFVDECGTQYQDMNDETFLYMICRISFFYNYSFETQSIFLNDLMRQEAQIELRTDLNISAAHAVHP
jgi:hypothetical protein